MRKRTLFASTVLALATLAAAPGVASAASVPSPGSGDPGPIAQGRLTLGSMAGPVSTFTYLSCANPTKTITSGTYAGFDNAPLTGCQVSLVNAKGADYVLCAGTGAVPADFQARPTVVVQKGLSVACP